MSIKFYKDRPNHAHSMLILNAFILFADKYHHIYYVYIYITNIIHRYMYGSTPMYKNKYTVQTQE